MHYSTGNRITLLEANDQCFPALEGAIDGALRQVHLESCIFLDDASGRRIGEALARAARRVVAVRLLSNGIGSRLISMALREMMPSASVGLLVYRPKPKRFSLCIRQFRRMHHELAVIDGILAFSSAERASNSISDTAAVFAQGPIGLCATAGAKLIGTTTVIGVHRLLNRHVVARRMGAENVIDSSRNNPVEEIMRLSGERGVVVAIEALGTLATFEACWRVLRPGGALSSLAMYSTDLTTPLGAVAAGLGDHWIATSLCPGDKERVRRLKWVTRSSRVDLDPMVTPRYTLDDIEEVYELFSHQRDGVLKVAITP